MDAEDAGPVFLANLVGTSCKQLYELYVGKSIYSCDKTKFNFVALYELHTFFASISPVTTGVCGES